MTISAAEARHLKVRRLGIGDHVGVFDGAGGAGLARIAEVSELGASLELLPEPAAPAGFAPEYPFAVTLAVALLKGDKLSDVVRAATELGASRIDLLVCQHADVRDIGASKLTRLRRVAAEASKQSRRALCPEVSEPAPLRGYAWEGQGLVAHPSSPALAEVLPQHLGGALTFFSGPEGGFSAAEVELLLAKGAKAVGLGPRILRAETAPTALLGALAAQGM